LQLIRASFQWVCGIVLPGLCPATNIPFNKSISAQQAVLDCVDKLVKEQWQLGRVLWVMFLRNQHCVHKGDALRVCEVKRHRDSSGFKLLIKPRIFNDGYPPHPCDIEDVSFEE
jgi:hypothetical protein